MPPEQEDVSDPSDRTPWLRDDRSLLHHGLFIAGQETVDLAELEPCNLDGLARNDEFFQLGLQFVEAPGPVFAEFVDRDPQQPSLVRRQMSGHDAGDRREPEQSCRLDAHDPVDDVATLIDENRLREAEESDRWSICSVKSTLKRGLWPRLSSC